MIGSPWKNTSESTAATAVIDSHQKKTVSTKLSFLILLKALTPHTAHVGDHGKSRFVRFLNQPQKCRDLPRPQNAKKSFAISLGIIAVNPKPADTAEKLVSDVCGNDVTFFRNHRHGFCRRATHENQIHHPIAHVEGKKGIKRNGKVPKDDPRRPDDHRIHDHDKHGGT